MQKVSGEFVQEKFKIRYQTFSPGKARHLLVRGFTRVSGKIHLGSAGCCKRIILVAEGFRTLCYNSFFETNVVFQFFSVGRSRGALWLPEIFLTDFQSEN